MLKPPIPYYGAKSTLAQRITSLFPAHRRYVEPFFGSGAVLLAKPPSRFEVVNDLDGALMTFWRVLRDRPTELARVCALTPHSRGERKLAQELSADLPELETARRVFVALTQGRSGTLTRTGWRHDVAGRDDFPGRTAMFTRRIEAVSERLRNVTLECRPAVEIVERYGRDAETLIYVDPPYLGSTRGGSYRAEMGGAAEHRELAAVLLRCRATVILSGYHSELYDELYRDWFRVEFPARTTQGHGDSERVEVVWSNRKDPLQTAAGASSCNGSQRLCERCLRAIPRRRGGPPPTYCSGACRVAAHRLRRAAAAG